VNHPLGVALAVLATIPTTDIYAGMPPERFQQSAELHVKIVPEPNSIGACGLASEGTFAACVRGDTVFLPNPCPLGATESFARLVCHEMAHHNGWPAKHGP
jgi:hypothetical protein